MPTMTKARLFPNEIIELENQHPFSKYSKPTQTVYLASIALILSSLALLPFINVDISVKSNGMLRPIVEVCQIRVPSPGKVSATFTNEGSYVKKGQVLLTLDSTLIAQKRLFIVTELNQYNLFAKDLRTLLSPDVILSSLTTPLYRESYLDYNQRMKDAEITFSKVKANYKRQMRLHNEKVIADADFENSHYEFEKSKNDLEKLKKAQLAFWEGELIKYSNEIARLTAELAVTKKDAEDLQIRATLKGTLESFSSLPIGTQVFAGQDIGHISPDTILVADVLVDPADIGLLKQGMKVRFNVYAFNYNQWGLASGWVTEIGNDIHMVNERPFFKVKCSLMNDFLQLKNGYKGKLRKGMTLQARFLVAERSLWQLLYDKTDDWLNPNGGESL